MYVLKWYLIIFFFMLCMRRFHRFHWYIVILPLVYIPFFSYSHPMALTDSSVISGTYSKFSVFSFIDFIPWCTCMIKFFKKYFYKVNLLCFIFWADSVFCNMKIKLEDPLSYPFHGLVQLLCRQSTYCVCVMGLKKLRSSE